MGERDPDAFWEQVHANLVARRLRLVFVADAIPPELERIVDFLNEQMQVTEVLAIEVKQFVDTDGAHQTIVPRVLGQTQTARQVKKKLPVREWTRDSIVAEVADRRSPAAAAAAKNIIDWADKREDVRAWLGKGMKDGSFMAIRDGDRYLNPFGLWSYGRVEIHFQYLLRQAPFDDEYLRDQLRQRLNLIDGVDIPTSMLSVRPSIPLDVLASDDAQNQFLAAMDWAFEQALPATDV